MLEINIITVGKLKEAYLREACAEYIKRLGSSCKLKVYELAESRLPENPSDKEIAAALAGEAKEITPLLSSRGSLNIAMCIEGKQLSSPELAQMLERAPVEGKSVVNFVIGSSFGIDDAVKNVCAVRLSMSRMTFPHQLARVMLLEQVYRAFRINAGGKYHK